MLPTRKRKAFLIQTVLGLLLLIGGALLIRAILQSLEGQGISSGFGFLHRSTGWDVGFSLIEYTINDPYWKVILVGVLNTLFLGSIGLVLATVLGVLIGVLRTSANPVMAFLGTCYIEAIRNVPLILQAFFWYAVFTHLPPPKVAAEAGGIIILSSRGIFVPGLNVVPGAGLLAGGLLLAGLVLALILALWPGRNLRARELLPLMSRGALLGGIGLAVAVLLLARTPGETFLQFAELKGLNFRGGIRVSPEFAALLTAMSLYGGAFLGEIIRAGFMSVSRGQIEAAQALGLGGWQVFSRVRLPLALRAVLPTLTNQYVWLLKATTLGIAVGFSDFFLVISTAINQSGQTLELILILMGGFLIINNLLAAIMNFINRRIALRGSQLRI
ncbi:MAG: ABC transporter permease [Rhodobacteraceae bacterium GWE1_64_9]|nr:MAG: ABC transporter permease [Rhodobacteraceae bacterium GWE1_64_9]OHC51324.1 MAG: ABC transporter permease [Rhodobacteraceae bacterium GWF1_65_7]HBU14752.1 ABC transporter permease [Gemmobacter sp.]